MYLVDIALGGNAVPPYISGAARGVKSTFSIRNACLQNMGGGVHFYTFFILYIYCLLYIIHYYYYYRSRGGGVYNT
jgi:hypothetical protein